MIAVIDYGMGNLRSVEKALQICGGDARITASAKDIKRSEKIVFPGVGSFGEAMDELASRGLIEPIKEAVASGKYFLGLCLGLQLLFDRSEESPGVKGLSILPGKVTRFSPKDARLKVPHMGWNDIKVDKRYSGKIGADILKGLPKDPYMYFVHSYYVEPLDRDMILTTTCYDREFVSGIKKDNIYGLQFHPEKSQSMGLKILKNFCRL